LYNLTAPTSEIRKCRGYGPLYSSGSCPTNLDVRTALITWDSNIIGQAYMFAYFWITNAIILFENIMPTENSMKNLVTAVVTQR
jgi:hypothetical protein